MRISKNTVFHAMIFFGILFLNTLIFKKGISTDMGVLLSAVALLFLLILFVTYISRLRATS